MYRHIPSSTRKWFAISRKAKLLIAIQDANAFRDSPLERLETSMAIDKNSRHTGSLFEGIGWCWHCSGARDKLTLTRYSRPTMTAKQQCHGSPQAAKSKKVWQRILSEDTRPSSAVKHYNHWQILWWSHVLHILIDCGVRFVHNHVHRIQNWPVNVCHTRATTLSRVTDDCPPQISKMPWQTAHDWDCSFAIQYRQYHGRALLFCNTHFKHHKEYKFFHTRLLWTTQFQGTRNTISFIWYSFHWI